MTLFVGALAPVIWLQPGEEGTTKPAVFRPARELYPNGELRLDPMRTLFGFWHDGERGGLRLERVQLFPDETELRVGKPRSDAPDISELVLVVEDGEQQ